MCNTAKREGRNLMNINFSKLTAAGNDFILIDNRGGGVSDRNYQYIAKKLCNRRYSIGADGVIFLEKSVSKDFKMKYFNSDGSHAAMCGNGGRSAVKFAHDLGIIMGTKIIFETDAGIINAEILPQDRVKLNLYDPKNFKKDIKIKIYEKEFNIDFIDTGVPHSVIFVDNIDNIDILKYGKTIRCHKNFFPTGTNVNFVKILNSDTILVRTYERGVEGETLACGTGITASGIVSVLRELVQSPVNIISKGGDRLLVSLKNSCGKISDVVLEGPAVISFRGVIEI
jgi:diaminopimelate epimerase